MIFNVSPISKMAKKAPLKRKCVMKNTCIVLNLIVLCFPSRRVPKKPKWEPWSPQMMASSNTDLDPKSYVNQGDPRMNTKAALKARKGQWLLPPPTVAIHGSNSSRGAARVLLCIEPRRSRWLPFSHSSLSPTHSDPNLTHRLFLSCPLPNALGSPPSHRASSSSFG